MTNGIGTVSFDIFMDEDVGADGATVSVLPEEAVPVGLYR